MMKRFAIITPLANEADTFLPFTEAVTRQLDELGMGEVYLVVDNVSKDNTFVLCRELEKKDPRFHTIWAPENKNVVDAYLRGYKEAIKKGFDYYIEMDAGLSHNPAAIPQFLRCLSEGHNCVFGSRFINGGSIIRSHWYRSLLSRGGTILTNILLGTRMKDMTSGYMGFHHDIVERLVRHRLLSKAHFYQTEVRYLLRNELCIEVPIHYQAPSPRVSFRAVKNSLDVLFYYFGKRLTGRNNEVL